jgi:hypothetical protein
VVGRVLLPAQRGEPGDHARQLAPVGDEEREVVEAGGLGHDRPFGSGVEDDELAAVGGHAQRRAVGLERGQPDIVAVEAQRAIGVGDGDLHRPHAGPGGYRLGLPLHVPPSYPKVLSSIQVKSAGT